MKNTNFSDELLWKIIRQYIIRYLYLLKVKVDQFLIFYATI